MITDGLKLTSYFGERQRSGGQFVADALAGLYGRQEVAASILLRGAEGFGLKHRLRTDLSLSLSEDLPLTAIAVDGRARIEALAPEAVRLTGSGLVTLERARLLTGDLDGHAAEGNGGAAKVTIYLGRQERVYRVPAFVAVCDLLHRRGVDGATALLGVDGTAHGRRERALFFSRNAEVPMMVIAVGAESRITRVLPELGGLLARPLVTVEKVVVCKRDGQLLCPPPDRGRGGERRAAVAEADGVHVGGGPGRRPAHPPGHRPAAALGRAVRGDHAAGYLGVPRRPCPAR